MGSVETETEFDVGATPDGLFSMGQIRLSEISVFNWGSFHGLHTVKINPEGTLITGDNGSGKTTIIDGLMALLLPASKAHFNVAAAQGDKTDRSLLSYIRGSYGSDHDGTSTRIKSKRDGSVCSGLRALYLANDGTEITLAVLFFLSKNGRSVRDVERLYIAAKRNLTLKELLDKLGAKGEKRKLKQALREDPTLKSFDQKFSTYQEYYSKLLHIENRNAPNLLSRALGLKKIDDLTDLIRELVLEPSSVKDDGRKIVEEFADLVGIHSELQNALEQSNALRDLPDVRTKFLSAKKESENIRILIENTNVYVGEATTSLWKQKVLEIESEIKNGNIALSGSESKKKIYEEQRDRCYKSYIEQGGNRIEEVKKELGRVEKEFSAINIRASAYQDIARNLGLIQDLTERSFSDNKAVAEEELRLIESNSGEVQDKFGDLRGKLSNLASDQNRLKADIAEIERRPDSAIDPKFQRLKLEITESLDVDPNDFVFVGELISVKPEERGWQGAIERALGGRSTTLLVPASCRSMVTKWLNARNTGLHVRVEEVTYQKLGQASFKAQGYLKKLEWKDHHYRDWLKHYLAGSDLACVNSTVELDASEYSITKQGLIRLRHGRLEKNDTRDINDQRFWNVGFSNRARLDKLKQELISLEKNIETTNAEAIKARGEWNQLSDRRANLEKLVTYSWSDIDVQYALDLKGLFQEEIENIESSNKDLYDLETQYAAAKEQVIAIDQEIIRISNDITILKADEEKSRKALEHAREVASSGLEDWVRESLSKYFPKFSMDLLADIHNVTTRTLNKLQRILDEENEKRERLNRDGIRIMANFRGHEKWRVIAEDWGSDIESIDHYIDHYEYLVDDGLPDLKDKFIAKLNQDSTQSLASLRQRLQSEHEDIRDRIEVINDVLRRTEFREGTYLRLVGKKEEYSHVDDFNKKVTRVLAQSIISDPFERFDAVREVVSVIQKASIDSPNTLESQQLLDPRHQLRFIAEEVRREDKKIIDTLTSSSGKSGGEKESFAGIIVAASLAYVLTPDGHSEPIYSTVFLDEAFSNTSEAVSRRVLKVFKELNIHVNLITPYKNLNIARESARSLLIAERDADKHESRFIELTWEEIDQYLLDLQKRNANKSADELGIELEGSR